MKHWFRFSIADSFTAIVIAAIFVVANVVQRDIGSGVYILQQGWPMPAATNHSLNGITIHWAGVWTNIVTGVATVGVAALTVGKLRRLLVQKPDVQLTREVARKQIGEPER